MYSNSWCKSQLLWTSYTSNFSWFQWLFLLVLWIYNCMSLGPFFQPPFPHKYYYFLVHNFAEQSSSRIQVSCYSSSTFVNLHRETYWHRHCWLSLLALISFAWSHLWKLLVSPMQIFNPSLFLMGIMQMQIIHLHFYYICQSLVNLVSFYQPTAVQSLLSTKEIDFLSLTNWRADSQLQGINRLRPS